MIKSFYTYFGFSFITNYLLILLFLATISENTNAQQKSIILGRPTNTTITASILFDQNMQYYIEYGIQTGNYTNKTSIYNNVVNVPDEIDLINLAPNSGS